MGPDCAKEGAARPLKQAENFRESRKWGQLLFSPPLFLAHQVSDQLLSDQYGQEALKAVYRFVSYNSEWIQRAVGVTEVVGGGQGGGKETDG